MSTPTWLALLIVTGVLKMNFLDQINWQTSRLWRRTTEGVEYVLSQLSGNSNSTDAGPPPAWLEALALWLTRGLAIILGLIFLFLLARFLRSLWRYSRGQQRQSASVQSMLRSRPQRVQDWLEQARQYQAQGDYTNACRALYMALLIHLETGGWLKQDQARTDREYLRSLESLWALGQRPSHLRAAFYEIFQAHEQLCYADQVIAPATFNRCQSAYFELEPELGQRFED